MKNSLGLRVGLSGALVGIALSLVVSCDGASGQGNGLSTASKTQLQVINGDFEVDAGGWWGTPNLTLTTEGGRLCVDVPGGTVNPWDAIVGQSDLKFAAGEFAFEFTASATPGGHVARSLVQLPVDPYTPFAELPAALTEDDTNFSQTFTSPGPDVATTLQFQLGGSADPWTFCVDDVSVAKPKIDLARNGSFDSGTDQWWWTSELALDASSGEACTTVPAGGDPWSHIIGQGGITLVADGSYEFSFLAKGNSASNVRALVQLNAEPWTGYIELNQLPGPDGTIYSGTFTAPASGVEDAAIQFQVGGASEAWEFCVDDVKLLSDAPIEYYTPETGPIVRVNQHGYVAYGPKKGTLVTDAEEPLPFSIQSANGTVLLSGQTVPEGFDPSAGVSVHTFDFSSLTSLGEGLVAVAAGEQSYPFGILADAYESLRIDALNFYYTQRSGIEIDGSIAGPLYARPAGHVSAPGAGPNQGDVDVPCQPASNSEPIYGEAWTCDYTLDVSGGWYDAGDHGKYVVNGGIAVHQLLNIIERTGWAPNVDKGALGDGSLAIPESDNGVPDLLDEVRWELEFFLKMVVPEGEPLAGMVHHKVHDHEWTGLPLLPHLDDKLRWLHRPSTAATLNLAATAAQAARIYKKYDKAFAATLLEAAEDAWQAALEHPDLYAPLEDGASGGGPYNDADVTDEFYWAAAELYLTTENCKYLDYVLDSPHHTGEVFTTAGFIWYQMAALARIDLATVPSKLPDLDEVQDSVLAGAELYLASQAASPFGQPYLTDNGEYVWGSNSQILNNIVVLAVAYDLSGDERYRDGALEGLDYILGRNALNYSYVTGYGTVNAHNQHSRWYANQLNPDLPSPPTGSLAGGPNSHPNEWDPTMARLYGNQSCAPQMCYVDDINSWSTNELTLNWNSTLAWVASWAADQDSAKPCTKKAAGKKAKKQGDAKVCKAEKKPKKSGPKKAKKGQSPKKAAHLGPKFPGKHVPKYVAKFN